MNLLKTSGSYERLFERLFKTFEIEMVRFNRITQGDPKRRVRNYTDKAHTAKACRSIDIVLAYEGYDLSFVLTPNLDHPTQPVNVLSLDVIFHPQENPLIVPIDLLLAEEDLRPTIFQDLLTEDLVLDAVEAHLSLVRLTRPAIQRVVEDPQALKRLETLIAQDVKDVLGLPDTPENHERWILEKRRFATSKAVKLFWLGDHKASQEAFETMKVKGGIHEKTIKAALDKKLSSKKFLTEKQIKNYTYVLDDKHGIKSTQTLKTYGLATILALFPIGVLVYFVMGFAFWWVTLYSFYKTAVNTWFGIIPLIIASAFAAIWAMPLAHQILYPEDHTLYRAYEMIHKHEKKTVGLKALGALVIVFMLTISAWNGNNILVFNEVQFALEPGFLWIPPIEFETYKIVDHVEYRETLTTQSGKTVPYHHYVMVMKDGSVVKLKDHIALKPCEEVLLPFLERRNINTIR